MGTDMGDTMRPPIQIGTDTGDTMRPPIWVGTGTDDTRPQAGSVPGTRATP
jgi:hypothetical protein